MAYYLKVPATADNVKVEIPAQISATSSGNFEIEFEVEIFGTNGVIANGAAGLGTSIFFFTTLTNFQIRIASSQRNFTLPQSAAQRHVYRVVSSTAAGNIEVFQDGVSCGTTSGNTMWPIIDLMSLNNVTSRTFGLYNFKVKNSAGVLIHNYDPSASNGSGNTLIDTVGGNNGTLINFSAVDANKWIFYSDGGAAYTLTPITGALSLTGQAVNLLRNAALTPQAGAFNLNGLPVSTLRNSLLTPQSGSYSITGASVTVLRNALLTPEQGAYTITGSPVELVYDAVAVGYVLTPAAGELALSGQAVNLLANRLLLPDAGAYTITGADVGTFYGRALRPDSGGYTITGSPIDLLANRVLTPESGVFVLTGAPVNLDYSGFIRRLVYGSCVHYVDKAETIAFAPNFHTIAFAPNNATIHYKQLEDC